MSVLGRETQKYDMRRDLGDQERLMVESGCEWMLEGLIDMSDEPQDVMPKTAEPRPLYDAVDLTKGGNQANIVLDEKIYTLRITRAGKLILTK